MVTFLLITVNKQFLLVLRKGCELSVGVFYALACGLMWGKSMIVFWLLNILLMEEILHEPGCINPVNNGILPTNRLAGFLPSSVSIA